jgi:pyruvate,water dikinase
MRRVFLAIGERLQSDGSLRERDDVFYLYYEELKRLITGELPAISAQELVSKRRAEMLTDAALELENTICGEDFTAWSASDSGSNDYLVGIGGSSGVVEGYARIVRDFSEVPAHLSKSHILVVPFTDVGWTPLFAGIGGIVAETGGQLSHTSIVAREYDLPAVVSVSGATRLLVDGQPITIDGRQGRVYLKHILTGGDDRHE